MPLQGARGGDPPGNRGNRRRGGGPTRVVTVYKANDGIYKSKRGGRGGGGGRGGRGSRGRGNNQGRGGGRGRGRGSGRGRGRGDRDNRGPSFLPEGKKWEDLTNEEKEDVTRQRNEWKAAELDKDLISYMADSGKPGAATAMLDEDLENYKKQGGKQKTAEQPLEAQPEQQAAEPMEQ